MPSRSFSLRIFEHKRDCSQSSSLVWVGYPGQRWKPAKPHSSRQLSVAARHPNKWAYSQASPNFKRSSYLKKEWLSYAFFKSTIFNCHLKLNYLHFVSDSQNYLCLQVNGPRELGSLKLIQMQGKVISVLILFDSLQGSCLFFFSNFLSLSVKMNLTTNQTFGCDHLLYATISPQRPVFQNTKSFHVKPLYLEPLVSDNLS